MGRRPMSMSHVVAPEANVATRHELFSTYCFSKDRKCRCRDTTRHALKKKDLTTDPSQKEALLKAKEDKKWPRLASDAF